MFRGIAGEVGVSNIAKYLFVTDESAFGTLLTQIEHTVSIMQGVAIIIYN